MGAAIRYPIAMVVAAATTFGLFFVMQALIAMNAGPLEKSKTQKIADILMPKRELELIQQEAKPEKPPEPEEPPPDIAPPQIEVAVDTGAMGMSTAKVKTNLDLGGLKLGSGDGEYLPIVKVAPQYPNRAATKGVEGYVVLEFTVTKLGTVKDPVVIEAEPKGYFERAATRAVLKFKYKPKVVDGDAVDVPGVQNKISFQLEK